MDVIAALFDFERSERVFVTKENIKELQGLVEGCKADLSQFDTRGSFYHTLLSTQTRIKAHCDAICVQFYTDSSSHTGISTITVSGKHFLVDVELNADGQCVGGSVTVGAAGDSDERLTAFIVGMVKCGDIKTFCDLLTEMHQIDKSDDSDKTALFRTFSDNGVEMQD